MVVGSEWFQNDRICNKSAFYAKQLPAQGSTSGGEGREDVIVMHLSVLSGRHSMPRRHGMWRRRKQRSEKLTLALLA